MTGKARGPGCGSKEGIRANGGRAGQAWIQSAQFCLLPIMCPALHRVKETSVLVLPSLVEQRDSSFLKKSSLFTWLC